MATYREMAAEMGDQQPTQADFAAYLDCHPKTVYNLLERYELPWPPE
jgi:hypothetical protein